MAASARPSHITIGAVALALAFALSGCSAPVEGAAATPEPGGTASPSSSPAPTVEGTPLSGVGSVPAPGIAFPIPDGTRSVMIDVECAGGTDYALELGASPRLDNRPLRGVCEGARTLTWAVDDHNVETLTVMMVGGVAWTATPSFSTAAVKSDPRIEADCMAFGEVYSAVMNADLGFRSYQAFDETEWQARIDGAADVLEKISEDASPELSVPFAQLLPILRAADRVPGEMLDATRDPMDAVNQSCFINQSVPTINAEFGG